MFLSLSLSLSLPNNFKNFLNFKSYRIYINKNEIKLKSKKVSSHFYLTHIYFQARKVPL